MTKYNKEWAKEYYKNNKDRWKTYDTTKYNYDPKKRLLLKAKTNAKRNNLEFNLSIEDIHIPTHCPYIGCVLTTTRGNGLVQTNMSIDRIDSTKGYVKGNVQVMSYLANRMKSDATEEQLVAFAKGVLNIHSRNSTP